MRESRAVLCQFGVTLNLLSQYFCTGMCLCMLPVGNAAVREQYFGLEEDSCFLIGRKKRVAFLTAAVATASEAPTWTLVTQCVVLVDGWAEVAQLSCYRTADNMAHVTFLLLLSVCLTMPIVLHSLALLLLRGSDSFPCDVHNFPGYCVLLASLRGLWKSCVPWGSEEQLCGPSFVTWVLPFVVNLIKKKLLFVVVMKGSCDKWESGTNN